MCECKYCGKVLKRPCALGIHERTCKLNPNRKPLENHVCGYSLHKNTKFVELSCKFCGKICKGKNSLTNHERCCPHNPNRNYHNGMTGKSAWNKGLTKETDTRIKKSADTLKRKYDNGEIKKSQKGKTRTPEEREHLSKKMKQYLSEYPEKVPYIRNHHSKGDSYCEKYFKDILDNEKIVYKQNYYQCGYFLDFAFPEKHVYFEVDGEQHYVDKRIIEHDKKRTKVLFDNGWKCLFRIRWAKYQKLSKENKENFIKSIIEKIKSR